LKIYETLKAQSDNSPIVVLPPKSNNVKKLESNDRVGEIAPPLPPPPVMEYMNSAAHSIGGAFSPQMNQQPFSLGIPAFHAQSSFDFANSLVFQRQVSDDYFESLLGKNADALTQIEFAVYAIRSSQFGDFGLAAFDISGKLLGFYSLSHSSPLHFKTAEEVNLDLASKQILQDRFRMESLDPSFNKLFLLSDYKDLDSMKLYISSCYL
jgi:hypothetical protein